MRLLAVVVLMPAIALADVVPQGAPSVSLLDPLAAKPPVAPQVEHVTEIHDDRLSDPYAWLRALGNPDVLAYLKAENAYTDTVMAPIQGLVDTLFEEMTARIVEDDSTWPLEYGNYWYRWEIKAGQDYWNLVRSAGEPHGPAETILDLNALAQGHDYFDVVGWDVTRDGRWFAYFEDLSGGLDYTIRMMDLETGTEVDQPIPFATSMVWTPDGDALYYVAADESARGYQLRRHERGSEGPDQVIYTEQDPEFELSIAVTSDDRFVSLTSRSSDTTEIAFIDPLDPESPPMVLMERSPGIYYGATSAGGQVLMRINDTGPNFRAVVTTLSELQAGVRGEDLHTLIPEQADATLIGGDIFIRHVVLRYRRDNRVYFEIVDRATEAVRTITFEEAAYSVGYGSQLNFDTDYFYYQFESPVTPWSTYALDMATGESTLMQSDPMPEGFTPDDYEVQRIFATAADGTEIPITIAMRRDTPIDGSAPLMLEAYGAYGATYDPYFDRTMISMLDRGVIYAFAHARGGGEYGDAWYDAGRLENKMNTFTDVIAAAEHLISENYTASDRMALSGASAGGLMVGAVINLRPDLFNAAILNVPFVDVLTAMLDPSLPLTTIEYPEWGNPEIAEEYAWIRAYDPYHNLSAQDYPDLLVLAGLNDDQVPYWQPAKYVARLRTLIGDEALALLTVDMDSGHGGDSARYEAYRPWAMQYAFLLASWGIAE